MYRRINQVEGFRAYFKGLGPNLIGVIPARSINFFTYGNGKRIYTELNNGKETAAVHLVSAATAGNNKNYAKKKREKKKVTYFQVLSLPLQPILFGL